VVFGEGNPHTRIMFVGEGPGQTEDETGRPFVGRAGKLLTQMIEAVGLVRGEDTYITNVVKCRPPGNRVPTDAEMTGCFGYLDTQIRLIQPAILVLVGSTALRGVLGLKTPISKIRGQWLETPYASTRAMAVFHPSYLLRNASHAEGTPRWLTTQDMQEIRRAADPLSSEHLEQRG